MSGEVDDAAETVANPELTGRHQVVMTRLQSDSEKLDTTIWTVREQKYLLYSHGLKIFTPNQFYRFI